MRGYLFCIGAAKAGTTWLYAQLRASPDIYLCPEKELHYLFTRFGAFNRLPNSFRFKVLKSYMDLVAHNYHKQLPDGEFARSFSFFEKNLSWYVNFARGPVTDSWYRQLFASAGPQQYAGDFSPSTCKISIEGVHAMRSMSPNVKIIYILREPTERLWSHLKFHAEFMGEFDQVSKYSTSEMVRYIRREGLHEDGQYSQHLSRFLEVFDRKDILVLDFEEIRLDPARILRRTTDFLDIPAVELPAHVRESINASKEMTMPTGLLDGFKSEMRDDTRRLEALGVDFVKKWYSKLT